MELIYKKSEPDNTQHVISDVRWLSVDEYPIFSVHLELCGQKPLPESSWDGIYNEGTVYCGLFAEDKLSEVILSENKLTENKLSIKASRHMVGRACVEKYSQNAWEVADVRVAKPYRNRGYACRLCYFVLSYILSAGKTATIRTEEDNFAMQRVIEKLGFTRYCPD